jgi:hypothetical protein
MDTENRLGVPQSETLLEFEEEEYDWFDGSGMSVQEFEPY